MNRKEVIDSITTKLSEQEYKKYVKVPKTNVTVIVDGDEKNPRKFPVRGADKEISLNSEDAAMMLDAFVDTVKEALMSGDVVYLRGLGTFYLNYRKERSGYHPITKMPIILEGRYTPKFTPSKELKVCAKIYEQSLKDMDFMSEDEMDIDLEFDEDMSGIEEEMDGE